MKRHPDQQAIRREHARLQRMVNNAIISGTEYRLLLGALRSLEWVLGLPASAPTASPSKMFKPPVKNVT